MILRSFADLPGRQVHYRRAGKGPPLLLIHASPGSSKQLEAKIAALAHTRSVIAPDTPRNGDNAGRRGCRGGEAPATLPPQRPSRPLMCPCGPAARTKAAGNAERGQE